MDFGDLFIFSNFSVDLTLHFVRVRYALFLFVLCRAAKK